MPAKKATAAKKTVAKKPAAKATAAKKTATAKKPAAKKTAAARKPAAKKTTAAKKPAAKKTTAAKKPAARKPAARKPAARKPAAKKTATKATTAKTAARKAPAKKAPAKKAAAKKPAAKAAATTTAKKPRLSKAAQKRLDDKAKNAPETSLRPRGKNPFKVGDKVVYPHHGAATIIKKERIDFAGTKTDYFVLEVATDQLTVRVPVASAADLGVRPVISKTVARKVFQTFKDEPQEAGSNWSRWYKLLTEKINSGDIFQVAEVVRDLTYAQQIKGISPALKRMLAKARLIIISELRFALVLDEEDAIKKLDRALPKVEVPVDA